jgi:RNA polymerase sigma-70 factor (ECF subfamily)
LRIGLELGFYDNLSPTTKCDKYVILPREAFYDWSVVLEKPETWSDLELIQQVQLDPGLFGLVYERYVQKIYNYVYYRTGNTQDAEDLTARVFLRAMNHIGAYKERGLPFSAWLYRIAHNLVANWHRDNSRRAVLPLEDQLAQNIQVDAPEHLTERREEHELLLQALRHLPAERQQLIILKFVERMPNAEIGAIMGRSEAAIKSLYHRTLLAIREQMHQLTTNQAREKKLSS